jgi:hypothetical protein
VTTRPSSTWTVSLLLATALLGIAKLQPRLANEAHGSKETGDLYRLPPPAQLRAMTLGYHAAAVDLLWANLLVEYGIHWSERREMTTIPRYVDALIALEPDYPALYKLVDTLLVYKPIHGTEADARLARQYLERGTVERPYDSKLWLEYGQFLAFIAPGYLSDPDEKERWRADGALAMIHAVDLGADADYARSAATVLSERGRLDAAIDSLRRAYAMTVSEDPGTADQMLAQLRRLEEQAGNEFAKAEEEAARKDADFMSGEWKAWRAQVAPNAERDYIEFLLVRPRPDAAYCVGVSSPSSDPRCSRDWDPRLPSRAR